MFKEFWDEKKSVIEVTGLFTAIGAIFLTIPIPENQGAKEALLNTQIVWLIIITILIIILFYNFLILAVFAEKEASKKNFNIEGGLTGGLFVIIFWFLINWWKYIYILYQHSLFSFLKNLQFPVTLCILSIPLYLRNKLRKYYIDRKLDKYFFISSAIITGSIYGAINASWIELSNFTFDFSHWLQTFKYSLAVVFVIDYILIFKIIRRENTLQKLNKILTGKFEWALCGGMAIAAHSGAYYRGHRDINIVLLDSLFNIRKIFKKMKFIDFSQAYIKINGIPVNIFFLDTNRNFSFHGKKIKVSDITYVKFYEITLPVIDLEALKCQRVIQKVEIEEKLKNEKNIKSIDSFKSIVEDVNDDLNKVDQIWNLLPKVKCDNISLRNDNS